MRALVHEPEHIVHQILDSGRFTAEDMKKPVRTKPSGSTTMLHLALSRRDLSEALLWKILLLGAHEHVNTPDFLDRTPLHLMVESFPKFILPFMHNYRIDTNAGAFFGLTPLHFAVMLSSAEAVESLLENPRTNLSLTDQFDLAPLHYVVDLMSAKALLANATRARELVNARDFWGRTPLHSVFQNVEETDGNNSVALCEIVKCLLEAGADKEATDSSGHAPFVYAEQYWPAADCFVELIFPEYLFYRRLRSIQRDLQSRGLNVSNSTILELDSSFECPLNNEPFVGPVLCADNTTVSALRSISRVGI
jgi:hypothetical protein